MFNLRKAIQNDNKVDDIKKKLMVKTHENCLIPSLGELLQARNGLRKTNKQTNLKTRTNQDVLELNQKTQNIENILVFCTIFN